MIFPGSSYGNEIPGETKSYWHIKRVNYIQLKNGIMNRKHRKNPTNPFCQSIKLIKKSQKILHLFTRSKDRDFFGNKQCYPFKSETTKRTSREDEMNKLKAHQ